MKPDDPLEEQIFDRALNTPSPERRAYLNQACGKDEDLRTRVEALLRAHERSGNFLTPPSVENDPLLDEAELTEGPGTIVGRYRLREQLGEGGMGAVFLAEQQEPIRREVALKVIKLGMDTRAVVTRFDTERQSLALMDHPNIARVLDAGATDSGRPYFVMELVHGESVTSYCDRRRLSVPERLELFTQVCQAVQHAHQKGIIHRDLKPSNVLVTEQDGKPVPKVIDFGVAKATRGLHPLPSEGRGQGEGWSQDNGAATRQSGPLVAQTTLTRIGQWLGTPTYMSPEQFTGNGHDVDTRSDIYSLGVLLYELLTGTTPFDAKRLETSTYEELHRIIREEDPPTPSTRLTQELVAADVRRLKSDIPQPSTPDHQLNEDRASSRRLLQVKKTLPLLRGDLDWIVMKALEKDRARRFETPNELAMDLQRHLNSEPVAACPPSRAYRFRKTVQRNKGAFAATAAVFVALVAGVVGTTWMYLKANSAQRATAEEAAISQAVSSFLQDDLLRVADSFEQADRNQEVKPDLTVREALERAAERIGDRFHKQPLVESAIRLAIGDAYIGLAEPKLALPHFERAAALLKAKLGPQHPQTLESMLRLGLAYADTGAMQAALHVDEETLELSRATLGPDHGTTLAIMHNLATAYRALDRFDEAIGLYVETLQQRKASLGDGHADTLDTMHALAFAYDQAGHLNEAQALLEETLRLQKENLGPEHPLTIKTMNSVGVGLGRSGRVVEALGLFHETVKLHKAKLGPDHPTTLLSMHNLAAAYREAGRFDEALSVLHEALELRKAKLGPDHRDRSFEIFSIAACYRYAGRLSEAIQLFEETLRLEQALGRTEGPITLFSMTHLAGCHEAQGAYAVGESLLVEVFEIRRRKQGLDHPETMDALAAICHNLLSQKRFAEAETRLRESLAIREKKSPDSWERFEAQGLLGASLLGQGLALVDADRPAAENKFVEAEPLLVSGYEGMKTRNAQRPTKVAPRLRETAHELVQLYEAWGKADQAEKWKRERAELDAAETEKK